MIIKACPRAGDSIQALRLDLDTSAASPPSPSSPPMASRKALVSSSISPTSPSPSSPVFSTFSPGPPSLSSSSSSSRRMVSKISHVVTPTPCFVDSYLANCVSLFLWGLLKVCALRSEYLDALACFISSSRLYSSFRAVTVPACSLSMAICASARSRRKNVGVSVSEIWHGAASQALFSSYVISFFSGFLSWSSSSSPVIAFFTTPGFLVPLSSCLESMEPVSVDSPSIPRTPSIPMSSPSDMDWLALLLVVESLSVLSPTRLMERSSASEY
mmetsp:Transcript_19431/g.34462  ORF Transcript_19431/g.34462 Transcript_19431/m.34462 type:complete len:272 (-) Transcript_19431:393-1208(-)